jgi:hypothetical protein
LRDTDFRKSRLSLSIASCARTSLFISVILVPIELRVISLEDDGFMAECVEWDRG